MSMLLSSFSVFSIFSYFSCFYFPIDLSFSVGLKNDVADFLTFKDLYISTFCGGKNVFITSSTKLYFSIINLIFGFGAFIYATLLGS